MSHRRLPWIGLVLIGVLFTWGLLRLFHLRFAGGEVYPPGSSRRADPLGTRALHDSLVDLRGSGVIRNYDRLSRRQLDPIHTTLILAGCDPDLLNAPVPFGLARELDDFTRSGGRLLLAVTHSNREALTNSWNGVRRTLRSAQAAESGQERLGKLWDVQFTVSPPRSERTHARRAVELTELPAEIPWVGFQTITSTGAAWKTIYASEEQPVIVERNLGHGTLVLLADDFLLRNEALRHARQTALLSWLLGPNPTIIFDEAHLGLEQTPGLASLIRRYQLAGAAAGLLLLAGLYVWQQSLPFNPRPGPENASIAGTPDLVLGRSAAEGFRNLLRRTVPSNEVLALLLNQWKESQRRQMQAARLADAQDLVNLETSLPPGQRDPVAIFRKLVVLLNHRG
jgi:hypothetical protein